MTAEVLKLSHSRRLQGHFNYSIYCGFASKLHEFLYVMRSLCHICFDSSSIGRKPPSKAGSCKGKCPQFGWYSCKRPSDALFSKSSHPHRLASVEVCYTLSVWMCASSNHVCVKLPSRSGICCRTLCASYRSVRSCSFDILRELACKASPSIGTMTVICTRLPSMQPLHSYQDINLKFRTQAGHTYRRVQTLQSQMAMLATA